MIRVTVSSVQFRPPSHLKIPKASSDTGIRTGTMYQHHPGSPSLLENPMVVQKGTGTTIDRFMSMGRSGGHPLPGGSSSAGAPGSVLWSSGA